MRRLLHNPRLLALEIMASHDHRFGNRRRCHKPSSRSQVVITDPMPYLEGAKDTTINNSTFNDVAGDATFNNQFFVNLFTQHLTGSPLPPDFQKKLEKHVLSQNINKLPCASAAYNDYTTQDKRRVACFQGTREALLEEIAKWVLSRTGPRLYLLWGIAGVGKSTVAHTVAERADDLRRLGASFFFSRNEVDRKNARMFFTTIAFHLCIFSDFARAIEEVLLTQPGRAAISKEPLEQLKTLILEPLRNFNHRNLIPIVIVVDALDECDDQDGPTIFIGLARLVQELPFFRVILTSRPQLHLQYLIDDAGIQTEFHLQNIEDKIVDNDIRLYLEHSLSHEQVQKCLQNRRKPWSASDKDIKSLVRAAGRLFIIASTAVLFILDKAARNPASRMKTLQDQLAHNRAPLSALNEFYTVILRSAVPEGCECDIVGQYQLVVGTIMLVQDPLPVEVLAVLIDLPEESVYAVLDNLQSVISISGENIPHVYHQSFPDYLTDDTRCKDDNLRIVPCIHHTRIALRCLQSMNSHLKKNIFGLGTYQGFVDDDDRFREEIISTEQLMKITADLQYACIHWADHVKGADTENVNLAKEVETFVIEHLLHWLEALSWIDKLEVAYPSVRVLSKYMKPTSSHMSGIISDILRFIARSSEQIRQSALYTYYCALPFTPTDCPLYRINSKETLCQLEGMPTQWDALVTSFDREKPMFGPGFSHDSSKFASTTHNGKMMLRDSESGKLIRAYEGGSMTVAHDFTVTAVSNGCAVTLWSVANNAVVATIPSKETIRLALSFNGSQLAVGAWDGTVGIWDSMNGKLVASLEDYRDQLRFSPRHNSLAFVANDGTIRLWNGEDGGLVTRLGYKSKEHYRFVFSRDGRRLASLTLDDSLTLWDGEKGVFISVVENFASYGLAISEDGSFIATGGHAVRLWSGNPLSLVDTLNVAGVKDLVISCDVLAVASISGVTLYDVNNRAMIAALDLVLTPRRLELSPDCTRLVVEYDSGSKLFDVPLLKASIPVPKRQAKSHITALAFSPDSSRLASGLDDGTVELWDTNCTERTIASHEFHSKRITTLAFALDGERFVSGSWDETIRFWGGSDGVPMTPNQLLHLFPNVLAFSPDLLAAATHKSITLFDNKSLFPISTLESGGHSLTFSGDGTLLASASDDDIVTVWSVADLAAIATFTPKSSIHTLTFSPDGSLLAAIMYKYEGYELFDLVNKHSIKPMGREHPSWIPSVMNGLLVSWAGAVQWYHGRQWFIGQTSRNDNWIGVLWIPEDILIEKIEFGSSIIALGCKDGHVLFVRFPATSIH